MFAGTARIDITPSGPVWMDGMIRAHASEGIHDTLYARTLVIANERELQERIRPDLRRRVRPG